MKINAVDLFCGVGGPNLRYSAGGYQCCSWV